MYSMQNGKHHKAIFESLADLQDYAQSDWFRREHYNRESFVGRSFGNGERCKAALNERWKQGETNLDKCRQALSSVALPMPESCKRTKHWNNRRGRINVRRLKAGESYRSGKKRSRVKAPSTITVAVDVTANGSRPSEEIMWRGVAAMILTELLEAAGYRVELWGYFSGSQWGGNKGFIAVKMKDSSQPLDTGAVINATSGWFFRTSMFTVFENFPTGATFNPNETSAESLGTEAVAALIGVPVNVHIKQCWSVDACIEYTTNLVSRLESGELSAA